MLIKRSNLMQQCADIYLLQSDFAVNKCLHTVASSWTFLLTLIHDARNHEFKKKMWQDILLKYTDIIKLLLNRGALHISLHSR